MWGNKVKLVKLTGSFQGSEDCSQFQGWLYGRVWHQPREKKKYRTRLASHNVKTACNGRTGKYGKCGATTNAMVFWYRTYRNIGAIGCADRKFPSASFTAKTYPAWDRATPDRRHRLQGRFGPRDFVGKLGVLLVNCLTKDRGEGGYRVIINITSRKLSEDLKLSQG